MLEVKLKVNNDSFVAVPFEVDSPVSTGKHYMEGKILLSSLYFIYKCLMNLF